MSHILVFCEFLITLFSSWTLAYHLSIGVNLPAKWVWLPFLAFFFAAGIFFLPRWRQSWKEAPRPNLSRLGALGLMGAALAAFTLLYFRTDYDDCLFFNRALTQLQVMDQPFRLNDFRYTVPDLPPVTILHPLTSYEPLVALAASLLGLDPLAVYFNLTAAFAAFLLPFIYAGLFGELGVRKALVPGAVFLALAFLLLEGTEKWAFGTFLLTRLWQGKCIYLTLGIPLTLWMGLDFFQKPDLRKFLLLSLLAIASLGLTSTALFILPLEIFAVAVSSWLGKERSMQGFKKMVLMGFTLFYPILMGLALVFDVLPQPFNAAAELDLSGWRDSLDQTLGLSPLNIARNFLLLMILPLFFISGRNRRVLALISVVYFLIFANPVTAPVWRNNLAENAYFRLAYLFPIQIGFGLLVQVLDPGWRQGWKRLAAPAAALAALLLVAACFRYSIFNAPPGAESLARKEAWGYKLRASDYALSLQIADLVRGKNLVAPANITPVLCLTETSVMFDVTRPNESVRSFGAIGQLETAHQKNLAMQSVTTCRQDKKSLQAFQASLEGNINAVLIDNCGKKLEPYQKALSQNSPAWQEAYRSQEIVLFLKD